MTGLIFLLFFVRSRCLGSARLVADAGRGKPHCGVPSCSPSSLIDPNLELGRFRVQTHANLPVSMPSCRAGFVSRTILPSRLGYLGTTTAPFSSLVLFSLQK